jgi:putative ABC transport system permease protein
MKKSISPPRLAVRLLERFGGGEDDYGAAGDFEEFFRALAEEGGARHARRACWKQVRAAFPGYVKNIFIWSEAMLRHYFRIAVRNLWKHKGYSFINIAGLAIGMAAALFILLWVQDELSFDRFHAHAETLFRIEQDQSTPEGVFHVASMPYPLGPIIQAEVPEITDVTRLNPLDTMLVRSGDKAFFERRVTAADARILRMFTFPLLRGDPATALGRPGSLVLTEDMAVKYFGRADPMGQTMTINNAHAFTVAGVLKNIPSNSSLAFDFLVPLDFVQTLGQYSDSLEKNRCLTFVRLRARSDGPATGEKITRLVRSRVLAGIQDDPARSEQLQNDPAARREFEARNNGRVFMLKRLVDLKLFSYFGYARDNPARKAVWTYSLLAVFVILLAGVNFMTLTTARSAHRAKEIGLRKVVGASRKSIIGQFYGESILTAFLAGAVSFILVILLFPAFGALSGKIFSLSALFSVKFLLGILAVILFTGIVAGGYPALFLSSLQPVKILKGGIKGGPKNVVLRKILVIFQFGLSILMLIGMGVVARQIHYLKNKNLGYAKEQLIYLPIPFGTASSYPVFKEHLRQTPRILGVTATHRPPTSLGSDAFDAEWEGKDTARQFKICFAFVDFDYCETFKIEMAAGRSFSPASALDHGRAFLVNEEIPKLMGLDAAAAVGKRFKYQGVEGPIVGVMKNFHYQSVREAVEPLAVFVDPARIGYAVVRLEAGGIPASLEDVKRTWKQVFPQYPVEYRFFDEDFGRMLRADEQMSLLLKVFAGIAMIIGCLGLFGQASHTAEQRTKEIGVRKVLGASTRGIVLLLSKEFARWVLTANMIAWPLAYFLMRKWLRGFAYSAGIPWWMFAAAGSGALALALLTVGGQAFRAARTDPVRALKYE